MAGFGRSTGGGFVPAAMPGIEGVIANMSEAATILNTNASVWNKTQCWDKIRVAELYIELAKEKLHKL